MQALAVARRLAEKAPQEAAAHGLHVLLLALHSQAGEAAAAEACAAHAALLRCQPDLASALEVSVCLAAAAVSHVLPLLLAEQEASLGDLLRQGALSGNAVHAQCSPDT